MKKLLLILLSVLLCVRINSAEVNWQTRTPADHPYIPAVTEKDYSDVQNDLVYHDYGTGIKLSDTSSLIISGLDLALDDETAVIYVLNMESNEVLMLCDYQPLQDITFTPASDGVYKIIAKVSNGEIIDLTPKAVVQTSSDEITGGFIPLK